MNLRITCTILISFILMPLTGCSSNKEKLDDVCSKLNAASLMTNDCSAMAQKMAPLTKKFMTILSESNQKIPDEKERALYIDAVSQCLSAYTEISTGPCGQDEAVKKAMPETK